MSKLAFVGVQMALTGRLTKWALERFLACDSAAGRLSMVDTVAESAFSCLSVVYHRLIANWPKNTTQTRTLTLETRYD